MNLPVMGVKTGFLGAMGRADIGDTGIKTGCLRGTSAAEAGPDRLYERMELGFEVEAVQLGSLSEAVEAQSD